MESLLVTLVGRGRPQAEGPGRYVSTPYAFREGERETIKEASFFGVALFEYLAERGQAPHLLLVGTEGSSWDYLEDFFVSAEKDPPPGWDPPFRRLEEEVKAGRVTQKTLDEVLERLGHALRVRVNGVVLSNSPEPEEVHQRFMDTLQAVYGPSGVQELHLDITHGYRHLGFVLLSDALILRHIWGTKISLHYGGLEMRSPEGSAAPVVDLNLVGELVALDGALGVLNVGGDFRPYYASAKGLAGQAEAAYLRVETNQQHELDRFLSPLRPSPPPLAHPLVHAWVEGVLEGLSGKTFEEKLLHRSRFFCQRGQYFKAILLLFEALLVAGLKRFLRGRDPMNYRDRVEARDALSEHMEVLGNGAWEVYDRLRRVRNAIAHGTRPEGADAQRIVASKSELEELCQQGEALFRRIKEVDS